MGINPLNNTYYVLDPLNNQVRSSRNVKFLQTISNTDTEYNYDSEDDTEETKPSSSDTTKRQLPPRTRRPPDRLVYEHFSSNIITAYATNVLYDIPNSFEEAINCPDAKQWKTAMDEEIKALEENETWELVELPPDRTEIRGRWVFTAKLNSQGEIDKYKARYVAKGCSQVPGQDYEETFSPTTRMTTIRALLQLSMQNNLQLHQMDVKSAYLHAPIDYDVYLQPPPGYETGSNDQRRTLHLKKSIYGLKQSGRNWNKLLDKFLTEQGFTKSEADQCLYSKTSQNGDFTKVIVWVDDLILASTCTKSLNNVKQQL